MTSLLVSGSGPILATAFGILGLIVGSFLGLVSLRLPTGQDIVFGRSRCWGCGVTLSPRHLVPVASYLGLRGRCGSCHGPIPVRYPLIEGASAAIGIAAICIATTPLEGFTTALLGWQLLLIFVLATEQNRLPSAALIVLLFSAFVTSGVSPGHDVAIALLGAAAGLAGFVVLVGFSRMHRRTGHAGGNHGLLLAGLGAWIGPAGLAVVLATTLIVLFTADMARSRSLVAARPSFSSVLVAAAWVTDLAWKLLF